ncbi:MAG: DUF1846 family protein [Chloroflexota bacterium]|nr:DUF1846 family protein [Chloroflexota bacterium]
MPKKAFSTEKYLQAEEQAIQQRLERVDGRLYIEVGGKLLADNHAARTLPGYDPQAKLRLLKDLRDQVEVIYCVGTPHLMRGKTRSDYNISYADFTIKALQRLESLGLPRPQIAINLFTGESEAQRFAKRLQSTGYQVFFRHSIDNYPRNIDSVLSKEGFGKDPYIPVEREIVLVNGPGPNSGKLSTCLGQLYHENRESRQSGFAKLETFPVWNLPLNHPVNIAYEAATADLGDRNVIDPFHLEAYNVSAVNYNRDVESFPILKKILDRLSPTGKSMYQSPTDMGINEIKKGIICDQEIREAARQEIIFYLFHYREDVLEGVGEERAIERTKTLMQQLDLKETDRPTVIPAREAAQQAASQPEKGNKGFYCGAAIELPNKEIVTGKNSPLLHAEAAALLNALKRLANIPDSIDLLSEKLIQEVTEFKKSKLEETSTSLDAYEVLFALTLSMTANPSVEKALDQVPRLRNCSAHTTHILNGGDQKAFQKLKIWYTTDGRKTGQVNI